MKKRMGIGRMIREKSGFTLLEAMVSVSIMSLITLLTLQAFHAGSRSWDVNYNQTRISGELRGGMERMTRELRNSTLTRILIPQSNMLQFQVPASISTSGSITWSGWMQYSLGGTNSEQLLRQDLTTNASTVLANKVTSLQFVSNSNPATLAITMTVQDDTTYGTVIPGTLTSTVKFRN